MVFNKISFEKKLLTATIGSAALVVAKENDQDSGESPFLPNRLKNKIGNAIESISTADIQLSLSLDNPNWEGEPAKTSHVLLKNKEEDFDDNEGTENPTYESTQDNIDLDMGILPVQSFPKRKGMIPIPDDVNLGFGAVPCTIYAYYNVTKAHSIEYCPDEPPYGPMQHWNMSSVTDFDSLFFGACTYFADIPWESLSPIINKWDTSSVTNMGQAFGGCIFGNDAPDLSTWDVSNVEDMSLAFVESDFNEPLDSWKPTSVEDMGLMFYKNRYFNQDLSTWATYLPKNVDISYMFTFTRDFNQCLASWAPKNPEKLYTFAGAAGCTESTGDDGWCSCNEEM